MIAAVKVTLIIVTATRPIKLSGIHKLTGYMTMNDRPHTAMDGQIARMT